MVAPVSTDQRLPAMAMRVTAVIIAAWIAHEGFSAAPYIPTKGDNPTIGNGATHYENGARVTLADPPITRQRAAELTANLLEKQYGPCTRKPLGMALIHPTEFAQAVDFAGNFGCNAWAGSGMVRHLRAGRYIESCQAYIAWRFISDERPHPGWQQVGARKWRFDCATPGNRTCRGLWDRQLGRYLACMSVQGAA